MQDNNLVRTVFGTIHKVKMINNNFSVKVAPFPIPAQYMDLSEPVCYGGKRDPDANDAFDDGNGFWIPLGDHPSTIAALYSEDLTGMFVQINYTDNYPWNGRAYIIGEPGQENMDVLAATERGPFRILSANGF
jgi:hypothetical protein